MNQWLISVSLLLFTTNVWSLIIKEVAVLRPKLQIVDFNINEIPFGFLTNATIDITIECDKPIRTSKTDLRPTLGLYICPKGIYEVTSKPLQSQCILIDEQDFTDYTITWNHVMKGPGPQFSSLFIKEKLLKNDTDRCRVEALFLNPYGQHLSSDQINIPVLYMALISTWLCGCFLWIVNCWFWAAQFSNKLHKMLTLIIFVKFFALTFTCLKWIELSKKGIVPLSVDIPEVTINSSFESLLFLFLMLAAEGWCIIWQQARLVKYYLILTVSYFTMEVCFRYVHRYFQGFAVVFASFMVYLAFKCCTISLTKVRKDLEASAKFVATHHLSFKSKVTLERRLKAQLMMFQFIHGLIIAFPTVLIVTQSIAMFLLEYHEWVTWMLHELIFLSTLIYLGILFRLRNFHEFENIVINPPYHDVIVIKSPKLGTMYLCVENDEIPVSTVVENAV